MSKQSLSRLLRLLAGWVIAPAVVFGAGNGNVNSISGNTPGFVAKATDLGAMDPNTVITVTVWLKLHNEAQLDNLVAQQHQHGSAQYHKLTFGTDTSLTTGPGWDNVTGVGTPNGLSFISGITQ